MITVACANSGLFDVGGGLHSAVRCCHGIQCSPRADRNQGRRLGPCPRDGRCFDVRFSCIISSSSSLTSSIPRFALQIAVASGANVIATSSSDAKLEFAKKLGAKYTINYKTHPDWEKEVQKFVRDFRSIFVSLADSSLLDWWPRRRPRC